MAQREVWQKPVTDAQGNTIEGASVAVFEEDGQTAATIYTSLTGGVKANPFLTGSDGLARFYAEPGRYVVRAQKGEFIAENIDVDLSMKALRSDLGAEGGASLVRGSTFTVNSIKDLVDAPKNDGRQVSVSSFWPDLNLGGGLFVWNPTQPKADHNGGTVIDPDKLSELGAVSVFNDYFTAAINGVGCYVRKLHSSSRVSTDMFGSSGQGVVDETSPIQAAVNSSNNVFIPTGEYLIRKNSSVDGVYNYGILLNKSVILSGIKGGTKLKRLNSNIDLYSDAYPLLHLGEVELSNTSKHENISVKNLCFIGSDFVHEFNGSSLADQRTAIEFRGVDRVKITDCEFTKIDSSAIWAKQPYTYSYKTSQYVNLNNLCDNISISGCSFYATPHTISGRARPVAINAGGDNITVLGNHFSWCDKAVGQSSTWDRTGDYSNNSFTIDGEVFLRSGKNLVISNNTCINSSEHVFYIEGIGANISDNTIISDNALCISDIKIRASDCVIQGNVITSRNSGISISELSSNVSVTGNMITMFGDSGGGAIDINASGLKTWIDNRPFISKDVSNYPTMNNIVISGNTIRLMEDNPQYGYGVRVRTDSSSVVGFPQGTLHNVVISDNAFLNTKTCVFLICPIAENIKIEGNAIRGKFFDRSSFTLENIKSLCVIGTQRNQLENLRKASISNNTSDSFKYIFGIIDSGNLTTGTGWHRLPDLLTDNYFSYFGNICNSVATSAGFLGASLSSVVTGNIGSLFLARDTSLSTKNILNSILLVGDSDSGKAGQLASVGSDLRYYKGNGEDFDVLNPQKEVTSDFTVKYTVQSGVDDITHSNGLSCSYQKLGKFILLNINIRTSDLNIGTTDPASVVAINMPFTSLRTAPCSLSVVKDFNAGIDSLGVEWAGTGSKAVFRKKDNSLLLVSDLATGAFKNHISGSIALLEA